VRLLITQFRLADKMNIPIFVINLDRSADRMQRIGDKLTRFGLTYERYPAIDGSRLEEAFVAQNYPNLLDLVRGGGALGGVGCWISHVEVAKLILSRALERACVIEDDSEFDGTFPLFVQEATKYPIYADAIKLEAVMRRKFVLGSAVGRVAGRQLAYVPGNNTSGSSCYIITKLGAQKAIEASQKSGYQTIDHFMFTFEQSGIKPLHVLPYPARQCRLLPSTISTGPKAKKQRRTMREVIQIRSRRFKDVFRSFWNSRQIIGPRMLLLTMARVQSKMSARA
jgi:glycosyl transferase family 25